MTRSRRWYLAAGLLLVLAVLGVALFAQQLTPVSPYYADAKSSILDGGIPPFPPSEAHPLGTDPLGRDVWSRVAFGARWSLLFAFLIMVGRLAFALPAGLAAAYGPRRLGWAVDRIYVLTSAIPPLLIYLLILSPTPLRQVGLWPSVVITISLLTLLEWPRLAVVFKGRIEQLRTEPFVEGAIAAGGTPWHIFWSHMVPHLWPTLLNLIAAEMGRALMVIAQLGIFGILVGGGVINIVDNGRGGDKWVLTTGVAEWGSLLSDGRAHILTNPWIPLAPAFAFLIAVVAFNVLSQGLEGLVISTHKWKAATTGRLHRRWRWALAAVPVLLVLGFYQGLPWTREAGIADLARRQAALLNDRNLAGYLETLRPMTPASLADARLRAGRLSEGGFEAVTVRPGRTELHGSRATVVWNIVVGYRDDSPDTLSRTVTLVRRWGTWYEAGEAYTTLRGYHVDVEAIYDPVDSSSQAVPLRWNAQYVATAADHAFERVIPLFEGQAEGERLRVRLYPNHAAFLAAVGDVPPLTTAWYIPGDPLRLSPEYLQGYKRWEVERLLSYEVLKFLAYTRLGVQTVNPLVLGTYELESTEEGSAYTIDVGRLTGQTLMPLPELFAAKTETLQGARQDLFVAQSAMLAEWLADRLPEAERLGPAPGRAWDLPGLAARLGTTPDGLSREYAAFAYQRLANESILTAPAARVRVPEALLAAIETRAKAVTAGDEAAFLATSDPATREAHRPWLHQASVTGYEATLLDVDDASGKVTLLERLTFRDGSSVTDIVVQPWTNLGGAWITPGAPGVPKP
ncbi:MAG TPA: ABC transporter permease [Symbiobacteriaceae bacterium]|nr:ABC transporter permease [Symbiobacteriaceae bacterium]